MRVKLLTTLRTLTGALPPGEHEIPSEQLEDLPPGTFEVVAEACPVPAVAPVVVGQLRAKPKK